MTAADDVWCGREEAMVWQMMRLDGEGQTSMTTQQNFYWQQLLLLAPPPLLAHQHLLRHTLLSTVTTTTTSAHLSSTHAGWSLCHLSSSHLLRLLDLSPSRRVPQTPIRDSASNVFAAAFCPLDPPPPLNMCCLWWCLLLTIHVHPGGVLHRCPFCKNEHKQIKGTWATAKRPSYDQKFIKICSSKDQIHHP